MRLLWLLEEVRSRRLGFGKATGDLLMILDADLTVPPEDLTKFWSALVEERGRLVGFREARSRPS